VRINRAHRRAKARREAGKPAAALSSPPETADLFARAASRHAAGQLVEAETLYRQLLAIRPDHSDSLHGLGVLACQVGRSDLGATLIANAIALNGDAPAWHCNLGNALKNVGRLDEAVASYQRALALKQDFADAHGNLGNALRAQGKLDDAIAAYRQALAIRPGFAEAHNNLGIAYADRGDLDAAAASHLRATSLSLGYAQAHFNLGVVLVRQGRVDEAVVCFRRAAALKPDDADAHVHLANALLGLGKARDAAASYHRALALRPSDASLHNNLGNALKDESRLEEAAASYERALALKPDLAEAHCNLGNARREQGRLDEAISAYERALALRPDFAGAHSNLLLTQHYMQRVSSAEMLTSAQRFGAMFDGLASPAIHAAHRAEPRRLRIGYVSGDFRQHAVGYFLAGVLEAHDRDTVEIFCYSNNSRIDATTRRIQKAAEHCRCLVGLSDAAAAALIREDGVDILVDLSGHTAKNRLPMFALRPAPVQVSWLGYFGSTGLRAIDYLVMDAWAVPPGEDCWHTEAIVRLPHGRFCYAPPDYAPPPVDPPARARGFITFGSFNNIAKLGPDVVRLWAHVLAATPSSRLVLKWKTLDDARARNDIAAAFAAAGVAGERLELRGFSPHADMLAQYGDIDVALDPFPFGGGLTSCEALWMGVPVVTMPGDRPASRQTVGFLECLGLRGCVARLSPEYVRCATDLGEDINRLTEIRRTLRSRFARSALCDSATFTSTLEAAFREMWRRWREGEPSAPFDV
jgi:protein O-GlcNAc transferase